MKRILYISLVLLGVMFSATACNDWLDVSPETEKKKEEMLSKESGYRNVLIGAYILHLLHSILYFLKIL